MFALICEKRRSKKRLEGHEGNDDNEQRTREGYCERERETERRLWEEELKINSVLTMIMVNNLFCVILNLSTGESTV